VNERRLQALLREAPVPGAEEAERRGLRVVGSAFAQRQLGRRPSPPRLALALAATTLLAALILTPAGAAVRDWVDEALTVGARDAEPALTEVPGGGRLLVTSPQGSWVVQPDGSRRLLGEYTEATWSPHGLFVGAVSGHSLSAVEPDGTVRWSLSAGAPVRDPRWSPSGFRIAYRAGQALRVVAGDGTGDRLLDRRVAPVAPAWSPGGPHLLAYSDLRGGLRIANADSGEIVGASGASPAAAASRELAWSPDGSRLLQVTPRSLLVHELRIGKLAGEVEIGAARALPLRGATAVQAASFSPGDGTIAALLERRAAGAGPGRSELVLIDPADGSTRLLFTAPGRLLDPAWSPDGRRLLIAWAGADQWLFIPSDGSGRVQAVGGVSLAFAPGSTASTAALPRVEGWCCAATLGDGMPR
jgi:WD40-like Beta Propeller Repeat